ncbi:MAG TPA: hypothetical protein PLX27_09260 [Methanolinea sp.]|nr:hypothetical protein [Methanolinea sp.]
MDEDPGFIGRSLVLSWCPIIDTYKSSSSSIFPGQAMDPRLLEEYRTLNTIIERDKAVTSFKYALLRGTIEICQQHAHLAEPGNGRIWYPLGLLIEKWILYYYPLFDHAQFVPQLNGERPRNQSAKKSLF